MKQTHQLMTIFLILLISSSIQFKIKQISIENTLDQNNTSDLAQTNDYMASESQESQLSETQDHLENDQVENEDQMQNTNKKWGPLKKIAQGIKNVGQKIVDKVVEATKYDERADNELMRIKNNRTKPKAFYDPLPSRTVIMDKATQWNDNGLWVLKFLGRHNVDCSEDYSALHSFKFEVDPKQQIRYKYQCVQSPAITNNCKDYQTDLKTAEFLTHHSLDSLVKHYVRCPDNSVMKGFEMVPIKKWDKDMLILRIRREEHPRFYYSYTCCDANISRKLLARTNETPNTYNEYFELKHQTIDALDNNAISYWHMQAPGKEIFFEMEFATLQGETSPSYPDYFAQNTQQAGPQADQNSQQVNQNGQQAGQQAGQQESINGQQQNVLENNPQLSFTELKSKLANSKSNTESQVYLPGSILYRSG